MFYLGLDLSLTSTGIVVMNKQKIVVYANSLKQGLREEPRLVHIRNNISMVLNEYKPILTCIEGYAMGVSNSHTFSIGELGGVIKMMLFENRFAFKLVAPTKLKKFITGKGVAEKNMVILSVYKNFDYEAKDNDQADAYGLARMAYHIDNEDYEGLTKPQQEAIEQTINPLEKKKKKKIIPIDVNPTIKRRTL